jgi:predicted phage terminase large subunit-like protein
MIQYQNVINMLPVVGSPTTKDKITRMVSLAPYIETGKILFNKDIPYYDHFEEEFAQFPSGKHDDMLDCLDICVRPIVVTGEVYVGELDNSEKVKMREAANKWFTF